MKLLSVNLARALWIFNTREINPRGRNIGPSLVAGLRDRYRFSRPPQTQEELDESKGVKFEGGDFALPSGETITVNLLIYMWGLVADTRSSTQDSELFLKDVLDWATDSFGLVSYEGEGVMRSKAYLSELHVHTDRPLNALNPKLKEFAAKLTSLVKGHGRMSYETGAIHFWNDPATNNQIFPFRFERLEGVGFFENRYYSAASLETDVHYAMLEEFERILA